MESLIEDEELRFFDANEEITSCSSASSDMIGYDDSSPSISGLDSSVPGKFQYDVWIRSPENAEERRSKFFNWMGVSMSRTHHEDSMDSCNVDLDSSRIRVSENHSGAVLMNSGFDDEFSSCVSESFASCLRDDVDRIVNEQCEVTKLESCQREVDVSGIRTSENRRRVILRDLDFDDGFSSSLSSGSPASGFTGNIEGTAKENCELIEPESPIRDEIVMDRRDVGGIMKRVKEKWLSRLRKVRNRRRLEDVEEKVAVFRSRIERVKVKEHKKQVKELSALYKGQEIQAHEGSILTMKFSPDGKFLASAGEDGALRVWSVIEDDRSDEHDIPKLDSSCIYFEVNNLSELRPVFTGKEKATDTLMSPRKTTDSACVIFPPKIFRVLERPVQEFLGHSGDILDISWSKNNRLLSASVDKTVRLWQMGCDDCFGVFSHSNYVTSVQFNPVDDDYFISGSIDGKVRIWSVSRCQVIDWADVRDIVTAVCYRPDGQVGIVGTLTSDCRFYNVSDHHLQLDAQICLHNKKKSSNKRITGFQFAPSDPSRVMVVSADSQVRILDDGLNVVQKYKGYRNAGNQISASFTGDGKHIISACDDSSIYVWNCVDRGNEPEPSSSGTFSHTKQRLKIRSFERFSAEVSVAIPWGGFNTELSPSLFSLGREYVLDSPKGSATWPEEKLGSAARAIRRSQYKFLRSSCQRTTTESSHLWGLVIVTGGWDGRLRLFHNYGLPAPL